MTYYFIVDGSIRIVLYEKIAFSVELISFLEVFYNTQSLKSSSSKIGSLFFFFFFS